MNIIDTHCHLSAEALETDIPGILERADSTGVSKMINIAYNLQTSHLVLDHLALSKNLYAAVGIQPHDVKEYTNDIALQIESLAQSSNRVVAIGEIGLDAYFPTTKETLPLQQECFEHFLSIAIKLDLPVVVHVRHTHHEVLHLIQKYSPKGLKGVIHCFTGTLEEAKQFLDCGFFISFAGIVTFKNAADLAKVSEFIPSDRILIETDSPYLAPVPMRGKTNEPSYLRHTCQFIAKQRHTSEEEFSNLTYQNSIRLFPKLVN